MSEQKLSYTERLARLEAEKAKLDEKYRRERTKLQTQKIKADGKRREKRAAALAAAVEKAAGVSLADETLDFDGLLSVLRNNSEILKRELTEGTDNGD